jgi:hypothetical protein
MKKYVVTGKSAMSLTNPDAADCWEGMNQYLATVGCTDTHLAGKNQRRKHTRCIEVYSIQSLHHGISTMYRCNWGSVGVIWSKIWLQMNIVLQRLDKPRLSAEIAGMKDRALLAFNKKPKRTTSAKDNSEKYV